MKYQYAKKLHYGDEVISKENEESIRVLSIVSCDEQGIVITGVGTKSGYKNNGWANK